MQATITFLLTEQAQRAQMAATGQPVTRRQTRTVEVTGEDLPLCEVAADGSISVETSRHEPALKAAGWRGSGPLEAPAYDVDVLVDILRGRLILAERRQALIDHANAHVLATPGICEPNTVEIPLSDAPPVLEGIPRILSKYSSYIVYVADLSPEAQAAMRERDRANSAELKAKRSASIEAFMADPAARRSPTYRGKEILLGDVCIDGRSERYGELYAEIERRNKADEDAKKEAAAIVEARKTEAITAFVAASDDADLKEQFAERLLCRKAIISRMAACAFNAAGMPEPAPDGVVCDYPDCPCHDSEVDCIPPAIYKRWKGYVLPEGSRAEFRQVRDCLRGDDGGWGDGESAGPTEYHAIVTIPAGPFQFTRRIRI